MDQKSASWNHLHLWLRQLDALRLVAYGPEPSDRAFVAYGLNYARRIEKGPPSRLRRIERLKFFRVTRKPGFPSVLFQVPLVRPLSAR